jgi:hypothetical protein
MASYNVALETFPSTTQLSGMKAANGLLPLLQT